MYRTYANTNDVRTEIGSSDAPDATLLDALYTAASRFEDETGGATFEPVVTTVYADAKGDHISLDGRTLTLPVPMLAVTGITLGDGTVLTADEYIVMPRGATPIYRLVLKSTSSKRWTQVTGDDWQQAIAVACVAGYHTNYAQAWSDVTTLSGSINATTTTVTVASVSALAAGDLIRVGGEYMRVVAPGGGSMTVIRGVNGTTAASQTNSTTVSVFRVEAMIRYAAARYAGYLYEFRAKFARQQIDGFGVTTSYPDDLPGAVQKILRSVYVWRGGVNV